MYTLKKEHKIAKIEDDIYILMNVKKHKLSLVNYSIFKILENLENYKY